MSKPISLNSALCLPAPDIEALIQGRVIVAISKVFIYSGKQFALCSSELPASSASPEQYYQPKFLPVAKTVLTESKFKQDMVKAWAKCELCQGLGDPESLHALSRLTVWTLESLQKILLQRKHIFLVYLRVYSFPQPIEIAINIKSQLVHLLHKVAASETNPILSDWIFNHRKDQLQCLKPPLHPELEELEAAIAQLDSIGTKQLGQDVRRFLGWTNSSIDEDSNPDLSWISQISELGSRSKEQDEGKSNYQAGTDFENIVRHSLEFLGFTIDEAYKGGAGGLDLFCSSPYPLVGECKAGKSIPDSTAEQLYRIGKRHLKEEYEAASKLIVGPGEPTKYLQESAISSKISIINHMTLQRLVELHAKHPGSVDLIELKKYLESGQIDHRIDEYINKVEQDVELRSKIVQAVGELLSESNPENPTAKEVRTHYNAAFAKGGKPKIDDRAAHNLLIELSSPLTGYLGRIKGNDWQNDRFYFLRDLPE